MKAAVIGAGYWGPNLIRNFLAHDEIETAVACDRDADRLAKMRKSFYGIETASDHQEVINRPDIDIVAIATPVSTHHKIAKQALTAGKHCFIEKPMTSSVAEADELINLAEQKG